MQPNTKLPFTTLLLLISFATVNAVLFTPALPAIADFFKISIATAQQTVTWFLIGYAFGQLLYGPLSKRFGYKSALYMGISLQIISSLLCILAGRLHQYELLVFARLLMALGSGVGLKMTFTLVNERYEPNLASQKISYLMLAFAITPSLSVTLGGFLTHYYHWMSCFYASTLYGLILLLLVMGLPETQTIKDKNALKIKYLLNEYLILFKNKELVINSLLIGCSSCLIYLFASIAPFVAIKLAGMQSSEYGIANLIPAIGLVLGSLTNAKLAKNYLLTHLLKIGIGIISIGAIIMFLALLANISILFSLFIPTIIVYFGACFILANGSSIALSKVINKAHGSSVMNFINVGLATIAVLSSSLLSVKILLLPSLYLILSVIMILLFNLKDAKSFS